MRIIVHYDMDAFFAAVEERYNPHLRGQPIVVGADPKGGKGRGVVSTANYAARKYGIRSAMPISRAWQFSEEAKRRGEPAAVFLTGNYRLYAEVSERIMKMLAEGADAFEPASVDEAYIDLSSLGSFEKVEEKVRAVKRKIFEQEGLTCSAGIGPNKLIAKIASDFKKPDGLTIVRSDKVGTFLEMMPIRAIPGIGPKTETILHQKNIRIIRDLQKLYEVEPRKLEEWFGKWGEELGKKAWGISDSPVSGEWEAKSIGEQETFEKDTLNPAFILERADALTTQVFKRFRRGGFKSFRTVVVTVRFADFKTQTRSHTSPKKLAGLGELKGEMLRLLLSFLDRRENPRQKQIRLIGVRIEKLLR